MGGTHRDGGLSPPTRPPSAASPGVVAPPEAAAGGPGGLGAAVSWAVTSLTARLMGGTEGGSPPGPPLETPAETPTETSAETPVETPTAPPQGERPLNLQVGSPNPPRIPITSPRVLHPSPKTPRGAQDPPPTPQVIYLYEGPHPSSCPPHPEPPSEPTPLNDFDCWDDDWGSLEVRLFWGGGRGGAQHTGGAQRAPLPLRSSEPLPGCGAAPEPPPKHQGQSGVGGLSAGLPPTHCSPPPGPPLSTR